MCLVKPKIGLELANPTCDSMQFSNLMMTLSQGAFIILMFGYSNIGLGRSISSIFGFNAASRAAPAAGAVLEDICRKFSEQVIQSS